MKIEQPSCNKVPLTITQHGIKRVDNYSWLRDKNWQKFIGGELDFANQKVRQYLEEEASYTKNIMGPYSSLKEDIYSEILSRVKEDDSSCPMKYRDYFYYKREEKGKDYPIYCRKKDCLEAIEEIYFDTNLEAKDRALYILGELEVCQNSRFLLYSYNLTGSMERTLRVRDIDPGKDLNWEIPGTNGAYTWDSDGKHIFYVLRHKENGRGVKLYRFNVEEGPKSSELIFEKPSEIDDMFMWAEKSSSEQFLFICFENSAGNQVYIVELKGNRENVQLFSKYKQDILSWPEHFEGCFYILTNIGGATNNKIMRTSIDSLNQDSWEEFILEKDDLYISSIDIYKHHLIYVAKNIELAREEIYIYDLLSGEQKKIEVEEEAYRLSFIGAMEFDVNEVRYSLESPITPTKIIEYSLESGINKILKEKEVPNYDSSAYELKREFTKSHDGELIPLTLVYKKGIKLDGTAPAYVYGYGSYGISMPAYFSAGKFSLVDRGFVFVIAHIRGGRDKGELWYKNGKKLNKINTFKDYISVCEHLIDKSYTAKGNIVASGGSAGGLLMGAVTNMRPDLFRCVVADVPFVDLINTISDESLPLTPPEWEEWGNPISSKADYEYMFSYSPYDNIEKKDYPTMLYNSGISDEQVTYWEPAKMVAKFRALKTDSNILLLNIKMNAGHAGASKRYEDIEDQAFNYAFILSSINP